MEAIVNMPFNGTFRMLHETSDSVTGHVLAHDDSVIAADINMPSVEGGYLFSHTFTVKGFFKIKVVDSANNAYYSSIRITDLLSTSEEVQDVKQTYEDNHVITKERSVYIKQLLTPDFVSGGPVDFSFAFTPNSAATSDEESKLEGPWEQGVLKNFDSGNFDTSAQVSDIVTYTNGTFSIISTETSTSMLANQNQNTDDDNQWIVSDLRNSEIQDPEDLSIDSSSREDFSIRNFTAARSSDGNLYLLSGDVYRTSSSYGSIGSSDVIIGTVLGTAPSDHAHIDFTVSKEGTSETVSGSIEVVHGESRDVITRVLHKKIIEDVNNDGDFNDGLEWTYDAANTRINTHQPYLNRFDITFSMNNTDGTGDFGAKSVELVETTALLSSGLSEEERTALFDAASVDTVNDAKTEILGAGSTLAKEDTLNEVKDLVKSPWLS